MAPEGWRYLCTSNEYRSSKSHSWVLEKPALIRRTWAGQPWECKMDEQPGPLGELWHHGRGCCRTCCSLFFWSLVFYLAQSGVDLASVINPYHRKCSFGKNRLTEGCLTIWCQQGKLLSGNEWLDFSLCWVKMITLPIEFYWAFLTLREFILVLLPECWNRALSIKLAVQSLSHNSVFPADFLLELCLSYACYHLHCKLFLVLYRLS